jgi:tetratricopeptide (TPR) repeat protein
MAISFPYSRRIQVILMSAAILAATVAVYAPLVDYPFIDFDDPLYVMENPQVRSGLSLQTFRWAFTGASEATNYWAPLTWLSFLIDYEFYGDDAGGYHRTNLLLHAANGLLLFLLLMKMTGRLWESWIVAMLFTVHPLHVESVAWVAERKDVLSTFFALITALAYQRYATRPSVAAYVPVWVCFVLGIMAKPMLVTLPFVLLLLDYWPLNRVPLAGRGVIRWRRMPAAAGRLLGEKIPLFAVSLAASAGAYLIQAREGAVASVDAIPWTLRLSVAAVNYIGYLGKTVWPANLSILYLYPAQVPVAAAVAAGVGLAAITFFAVRSAAARPYLPVGWFWYLGTLFPVIGLVVIGPHAMADRYTYIPLIGIWIAAVWGLSEEVRRRPVLRWIALPGAAAVLVTLSLVAARQVGFWKSTETLFARAASVTEDNWFALNMLGRQYEKAGLLEDARAAYRRSQTIHPQIAETFYLLGGVSTKLANTAEAERYYREAIRIKPHFPEAHNNLGLLLSRGGRRGEAMRHYREALRHRPEYALAHYNLAVALEQEGRTADAAGHYLKALKADPRFEQAYLNLGALMYRSGDAAGARKMFRAALRINPQSAAARRNLEAVGTGP